MGHPLDNLSSIAQGYRHFMPQLARETRLLESWFDNAVFSKGPCRGGIEVEFWLHDSKQAMSPQNIALHESLNAYPIDTEVIRYAAELNSHDVALSGGGLSHLHDELNRLWRVCETAAAQQHDHLLLVGTPLTASINDFDHHNITPLKRYHTLNQHVIDEHHNSFSHINIRGKDSLSLRTQSLLLAGATASLQVHMQVPFDSSARYYNAAQIIAGPLLAACCNSPFLLGKQLWAETRVPLFEKTLSLFDLNFERQIKRAGFGHDYVDSFMPFFWENYHDYPLWLDCVIDVPDDDLWHLRLHNGTIYRWNRPIIGFDMQNTPHLRIENRVLPSGPTIPDMLANAAFFYGLVEGLVMHYDCIKERLPFQHIKANFYRAAKTGLKASMIWYDQQLLPAQTLILDELLPLAAEGLSQLGFNSKDSRYYLSIIEGRVSSQQTGSHWQQTFMERHPQDFHALVREYYALQRTQAPVHTWPEV